ncbi:MAG: FHA domain-containing protein [Polyangiaceae bacterium]
MDREPKYLSEFVVVLESLGPTAFQVKYRSSVLVGTGLVGKILDRGGVSASRRTMGTGDCDELAFAKALMGRVWAVRKDPGAPPGPMITVGQSVDNDITIAEYTLSTQHCGFSFDVTRISLTDLDSMNGTLVNDEAMLPQQAHPLRTGDRLALGRLRFDYLTGHGFFERVYRLLHGAATEPTPVSED